MAMVPIVFSDMASSRLGKHGRHDQRQAGEQDHYQHDFAEHLVVDLSVQLEAAQRPTSRNGRPSPYNLRVSVVKAPVTAIEIEITTKAANSTGWNTARCASRVQPRHWQEMVETTPPSPVSPPTRPLMMPMPMSGAAPIFIGLNAGRARP